MPGRYDAAGRQIAGLLGYNPDPGIYSRLERAIEAMPENVRVQELPGLLKRYKDGVPGWELKATDLDSLTFGRDVVPREELLARVQERSPVYTHAEQVRRNAPMSSAWADLDDPTGGFMRSDPLGQGEPVGPPTYQSYGQGGKDYTELLLIQPFAAERKFDNHWANENADAVAHARFDTHGDALRINELQSDLGIHNRKAREGSLPPRQQLPSESDSDYADAMLEAGHAVDWDEGGNVVVSPKTGIPFPLEDSWSDLLIKRLALEAARKGHRAIEVASPRAIADKVGGNIENYEHFYGKVVPGALERLGRKMGGLTPDAVGQDVVRKGYAWPETRQAAEDALNDLIVHADGYVGSGWGKDQTSSAGLVEDVIHALQVGIDPTKHAVRLRNHLVTQAVENGYPTPAANTLVDQFMPGLMRQADEVTALQNNHSRLRHLAAQEKIAPPVRAPARRYIMSDEMRRRILTQGIGAAVGGGMVTDGLLEDQR
jgi:hypothetical protein